MGQRLIDADRLKRHYAWWGQKASAEIFKEFKHTFDIIVDLQPTVEVPDIVRCKECKYYYANVNSCGMCADSSEAHREPNEYCSDGERRTDAEHT